MNSCCCCRCCRCYCSLFIRPFFLMMVLIYIFFLLLSNIIIIFHISRDRIRNARAFLLLLFYYIIMFCVSFSSSPCVAFRFSFAIHPPIRIFFRHAIQCTYLPSIFAKVFMFSVRVLMLLPHLVAHSQRHPCFFFLSAIQIKFIRWWQSTEGLFFTSCYIRGFV